ncbi:MAG: hypothetical protein KTR32_18320 [Granulosicoccus sp.]|nr:hypothetical protein [Granulosicoccus sp.]
MSLVILLPLLQGCGNKGELVLDSSVTTADELELLRDITEQPGNDSNTDSEEDGGDDEKKKKKNNQ